MIRYSRTTNIEDPHTHVCDGCQKEVLGSRGKLRRLDKPAGWITIIFCGDDSGGKTTYSWGNAHWLSGEACSETCCVKVLRSIADRMEEMVERATSAKEGGEGT